MTDLFIYHTNEVAVNEVSDRYQRFIDLIEMFVAAVISENQIHCT